jgi:N-methylhydantoinase B
MRPDDIYVTNDSYITGSHLNHVTLTLPIFDRSKLVGFSCCMAHWIDIGGTLGGMTTDIFSEGLQIPILKLHDRGKVNEDLVDVIRHNVRLPSRATGDLRAQVTAVKTGGRGFLALIARYGRAEVQAAIAAIMDRSEAAARARTRSIPDGVYEAESFMDDDGISIGKPIPIKVRVTVKGDGMTVDLTEVSRQVRGFYNSSVTTGHACAQVAYKCLTSPADYPINDDSFRSLKVIVPPGRVVSATRPAPMRLWMTFPMTIVDTVFKALAPAIPDRVIAGHHADLLIAQFHGINPRTSEFFIGNFGPLGGGWGAKRTEDGVSGTVAINEATPTTAPTSRSRRNSPSWWSATPWCRVPAAPAATAAASVSSGWCGRAAMSPSTPGSTAPIAGPGGSTAAATARAIRWRCASAARGRPIFPMPRSWSPRSRKATPSACAPAVAAATARRWRGRWKTCATMCGRGMFRWRTPRNCMAW